ncbi:serine hydrolase domain-containing protein [Pseudoalteromonas piscicida]|uniref:serine hydrolase domain-containing protein n=1 Tax=Pseudoalteromonas piscicida TaxID=43662 RepID=UPI0030B18400
MRTLVILIAYLLLIAGCSYTETDLHTRLKQQFIDNFKRHEIPAQAVLVKHQKTLLFANAKGSYAVDNAANIQLSSVFPIFSITKLFTNTLVMQLHEEGKIDITKPASHYLTNLPHSWHKIPISAFLSHTSGVPEYFEMKQEQLVAPQSVEQVFTLLASEPLLFPPNTQTRYTQTNYLVVGALLETVTKTDYQQLVHQRIIEPLNLTHTRFGREEVNNQKTVAAYLPNSQSRYLQNNIQFPRYAIVHSDAYSNVQDLSRFLSALMEGELVSRSVLSDWWQPHPLENDSTSYFANGWEFGNTGDWKTVGHDGGALSRVRIVFKPDFSDYYLLSI